VSNFSIARQCIVDAEETVVAYELFNRAKTSVLHSLASDMSLVLNVVSHNSSLVIGQTDLFINTTLESLTGLHWDFLVPQRTILEIPLVPGHRSAGIEEVRLNLLSLRKRGFRFAFSQSVLSPTYRSWHAIADFVKVNLHEIQEEKLNAVVNAIQKRTKAIPLAEKIETEVQFNTCRNCGFVFFQGYYFSMPEVLKSNLIGPRKASAVKLLRLLQGDGSIEYIEKVLMGDPGLVVNILRLANSSDLLNPLGIFSISQLIRTYGRDRLEQWVTIVLSVGVDGSLSLVSSMAIVRAKMMQLLALKSMSAEESEEAYLVGLLSLLDYMQGCSMNYALSSLLLNDEVSDALLYSRGKYSRLLSMAIACESEELDEFANAANSLEISYREINIAHMEAIVWADSFT
jgi:c-di-GMP-related signal transduction protein